MLRRSLVCFNSLLASIGSFVLSQDLCWVCGLRPPLSHVHKGETLKALLERIWAWVSDLGRRQYKRNAGGVAPPTPCDSRGGGGGSNGSGNGGINSSGAGGGGGDFEVGVSFIDFCDRRDAILRSLEGLLSREM